MLTLKEALEANSLEHKLEMQIKASFDANDKKYNGLMSEKDLNEMLKSTYKPTDFSSEELSKCCNKPASEIIPLVGSDTGVVILHFPKKGKRQELYLLCNYRKPARDIVGLLVDPNTFINYPAFREHKYFECKSFPGIKLDDADKGGVFAMRVLNYLNPGMWEYLTNGHTFNPYFSKTLKY